MRYTLILPILVHCRIYSLMPDTSNWPIDNEQREVVEAPETTIAVLAGPGSGKTRALSYRARFLLEQEGKEGALLLTFTNKAAAEMKARTLEAGGLASNAIQASTFHGFGARMLRNHGYLVGIDKEFDYLDDESQRELAERVASELGLRQRLDRWSYKRLRREEPDADTGAFGEAFEAAKREAAVVDYDDLIAYTADLLEANPNVVDAYATRYPHLLVDEFQDTNAAQFAIVKALAAKTKTVSVFADDDQAIFRFAGAELGNVKSFVEELGAKVYSLLRNYRSARVIVDAANALIACDEKASGRRMQVVKDGGDVRVAPFDNVYAEATAVVDEIENRMAEDGTSPGDIAILARSGYRVDELAAELQRRNMPVSDWRGPTYEPKGKQVLAICLAVVRGRLSDRQAHRLAELFEQETPETRESIEFLNALSCQGADELREVFNAAYAGESALVVAAKARSAMAILDEEAASSIDPILDAIKDFEDHDPEFSLEDLLAELALGGGGRPPTSGSGIKLATVHKTKGLQWSIVYLVGLEKGHLPHYKEEENPIHEERRLCFVGICRAEDRLVLTRVRAVGRHRKPPSLFLEEMGL
jgi:DNA helicase-2/ATP-dependent DNA helicase PcrA